MTSLIPEPDYWSRWAPFISESAEARCAQHAVPAADRRFEPEPAGSQYPHEMPAREHQHVALNCAYPGYDAVCSRGHLSRRLAAWAAIAEQLPVGALRLNLRRPPTLVLSVVPLHKIAVHFGHRSETRQFAGAPRTLQRPGKHLCTSQFLQPFPQPPCSALATLGQRKVRQSRMLA